MPLSQKRDKHVHSALLCALTMVAAPVATAESPSEPVAVPVFVVPAPVLESVGKLIPPDGVLFVTTADAAPAIEVVATTGGAPIEGTWRQHARFQWMWKPNAPLAIGEYTAALTYPPDAFDPPLPAEVGTETFTVAADPSAAPPTLSIETSIEIRHHDANSVCCSSLPGFGSLGVRCASTHGDAVAYVIADWELSTEPRASQFFFAVHPVGQPEHYFHKPADLGDLIYTWFDVQADEYCLEILALDLRTQTVLAYEPFAESCRPHGSLEPLGPTTLEFPDVELSHNVCWVPPEGMEERWCAINASCESTPDVSGCRGYGHVCLGEALPPAPDADMLETGGTGGPMLGSGGASGASGASSGGGSADTGAASGSGDTGAASGSGGRDAAGDSSDTGTADDASDTGAAGNGAMRGMPRDADDARVVSAGCHVTRSAESARPSWGLWLVLLAFSARLRSRARCR